METIDTALLVAGGAVLVLGIVGGWIKRRFWLSEPLLCLMLGFAVGPAGLALVGAEMLPGPILVEALAHVTLGIAVMEAALRLPFGYVHRTWRTMAVALLVALPLAWLTAAVFAVGLMAMGLLPGLILGALLAPTDPVLSASVVQGGRAEESLPLRTRECLTAESGANDGLGQLMLMLPVLLLGAAAGPALGRWITGVLLWDTLAALAIGWLLGEFAGRLMVWARGNGEVPATAATTLGLALTVTVLAAVELLGSGSILAVFAAGLAFRRFTDAEQTRHAHVQASISRFFTLPFFVVLGAELPWDQWAALGWRGLALALAVVTLRRLPWWWLLRRAMPQVRDRREALFLGFFGPIGTAAIYYALMARDATGLDFWPEATLAVAVSALVHGLSTTPATWAFSRIGATQIHPAGPPEPGAVPSQRTPSRPHA